MTEQELRRLVRDAIARHAGGPASATLASAYANASADKPPHFRTLAPSHPRTLDPLDHSSHSLFVLPVGSDADGPCIIEPTASCNHCGYCKSYGH